MGLPYTTSYITAISDMSLEDRRMARTDAQGWLERAASELRIRFNSKDTLVRDILPATDLGLAATDDWLIAGAGVAGTELQYFVPTLAQTRAIAFFGTSSEGAVPNLSHLRLTQGAASATTRGEYQLEQLYARVEQVGYFSEPVGFLPNEVARCMVMPRTAFGVNSERLVVLGRALEPIGGVISSPSI